jgi:hypothetical protein
MTPRMEARSRAPGRSRLCPLLPPQYPRLWSASGPEPSAGKLDARVAEVFTRADRHQRSSEGLIQRGRCRTSLEYLRQRGARCPQQVRSPGECPWRAQSASSCLRRGQQGSARPYGLSGAELSAAGCEKSCSGGRMELLSVLMREQSATKVRHARSSCGLSKYAALRDPSLGMASRICALDSFRRTALHKLWATPVFVARI